MFTIRKKIKQKNLRSSITIAFNSFLIQRQNVAQFSKIKTNTFNSHNISSQAHAARKEFRKKLAFTHTWNLIFAKFKQNKNTLQMYIRHNTRLANKSKCVLVFETRARITTFLSAWRAFNVHSVFNFICCSRISLFRGGKQENDNVIGSHRVNNGKKQRESESEWSALWFVFS